MRKVVVAILLLALLTPSISSPAPTIEEVPVVDESISVEIEEVVPTCRETRITVIEEAEEVPPPQPWGEEEMTVLAKMVWGEARGVQSEMEMAACIWCVLNRVDQGYGSIVEVVTAPCQFAGYHASNPVEEDIELLCKDVLSRWYLEKDGEIDVGRVLPADYLWFSGDGIRNHFRNTYNGGERWDWSLDNPYES